LIKVGKVRGPGVCTGRSGSIGGVFYINEDFWPLNTTLYIKDFKGNDPRYCYWLLNSIDLKSVAGGTGVPTLNRNVVHEIKVNIAEANEQPNIAKKLDKSKKEIDRLTHVYRLKIDKLTNLKQSLLAEAFSVQ
jgi:type I restriction enzyme S subunit